MNAMMHKEQGASRARTLIIIAGVILVGLIVWLTLRSDDQSDTTTPPAENQNQSDTTTPTTADPNKGYLVVDQWGVRTRLDDADKVTYAYQGSPGAAPRGVGTYEARIDLQIKPEYLQDKSCTINISLYRIKFSDFNKSFTNIAKRIGDYYYFIASDPYRCSNDADNVLNERIRTHFLRLSNLEAL